MRNSPSAVSSLNGKMKRLLIFLAVAQLIVEMMAMVLTSFATNEAHRSRNAITKLTSGQANARHCQYTGAEFSSNVFYDTETGSPKIPCTSNVGCKLIMHTPGGVGNPDKDTDMNPELPMAGFAFEPRSAAVYDTLSPSVTDMLEATYGCSRRENSSNYQHLLHATPCGVEKVDGQVLLNMAQFNDSSCSNMVGTLREPIISLQARGIFVDCIGPSPFLVRESKGCSTEQGLSNDTNCVMFINGVPDVDEEGLLAYRQEQFFSETAARTCGNVQICTQLEGANQNFTRTKEVMELAFTILLAATIFQGVAVLLSLGLHLIFEIIYGGTISKNTVAKVAFWIKNALNIVAAALNIAAGIQILTKYTEEGVFYNDHQGKQIGLPRFIRDYADAECFDATGTLLLEATQSFYEYAWQLIVVGFMIILDNVVEDLMSWMIQEINIALKKPETSTLLGSKQNDYGDSSDDESEEVNAADRAGRGANVGATVETVTNPTFGKPKPSVEKAKEAEVLIFEATEPPPQADAAQDEASINADVEISGNKTDVISF